MPTILCVMPHPDDESFGPAGTIAKYAARGVPVDLLVFTRGQVGVRHEPIDSPEKLGLVREYEQKAAAKVLGIRTLTFLDYMDGELENADLEELSGHVQQAIERSAADAIITVGPYGLTRHPDHTTVHKAAAHAVERSTRPVRLFYIAVEGDWAKQMNLDGPETQPTHRIEMADFFETKLMALACHTSQQDAREFFLMLSHLKQREELFHQAVPPFEGESPKDDLFA
ncbi:MAG: PIG-L deacetylase family protein [Dehalococcoidia bacterium]